MNTSRKLVTASALAAALLSACGTTVPAGQAAQGSTGLNGTTSGSGSTTGTTGGDTSGGSTSSGTGAGSTGTSGSLGGSTSGTTSTSGSGTTGDVSGTGSSSGTTGITAAPGGIPTSGRGWDAKHIYIGIPTSDDANAATKKAGANFDNGSFEKDANAVAADINRAGGIFGRQLVPVYYDTPIAKASANPAGTAQAICTYYTQDRPTIAVLSDAPQFDSNESFHKCLEDKKVTLLSGTDTDYSTADYNRLGPHLWSMASLTTDLLVPAWISALQRQGYFTGWNTTTGTPASTPAKVGILLPDDPQGHHVAGLITASLKKISIPVASSFFYDPAGSGSAAQSEVLQFRSDGVTHVLDLPPVELEFALFQSDAETQHYRPRHGFTSFDLPLTVEQNSAIDPAAQQVGSIGIGWQPGNDVNAQHDPGPTPGQARCLAAQARGGQTFNSANRRAEIIAFGFCDALYVVRDALLAGKGFDGAGFLRGMPLVTTKMAATFGSKLSATNHGVPGFYRDQHYDTACSCFVYTGGNHPFAP